MSNIRVVWKQSKHLSCLGLAVGLSGAMIMALGCAGPSLAVSPTQGAQTVKITPLGSNAGDFCRDDRALLFEDPTGVRVLWDPGRTIDGGTDGRLGNVHVVILSHAHTDHIGDRFHQPSDGCAGNATGALFPQSNLAAIAAAKNSAVFAGGEMADFLARKIQNLRGAATAGCPAAGLANEMTVPLTTPCTATLRPGGSRTVRFSGAGAGVKFASVPAFHSNGIPSSLVDAPGVAPNTTGYGGDEGGFIVQFTNGLVVYLAGDTGLFGDMETIVRRFYQPSVAVLNMSDTATLGPDEAAFAAQELIQPQTVIPSHINEAATAGGAVRAGTRLERFISQMAARSTSGLGEIFRRPGRPTRPLAISIVLPLSGVTREFDGRGRCLNCP